MQPQLSGPQSETSLIKKLASSVLSIVLLAVSVMLFMFLGSAEPPKQDNSRGELPVVEVVEVASYDGSLEFTVDGIVQPYRDLDVAAESGGRVVLKSANCQTGKVVAQGEILIEIDSRDYQFEVQRLDAELEQSRISVKELLVQIENAKQQIELAEQTVELNRKELRRIESITTPGAVTESEIDTIRRDIVNSRISSQSQSDQLRLLETSIPRLKSVITRIETQLETAKLALERCVIRSPIDGVITEEHVEQDGYLQKGALVFTVRDTSRLDVRCSLMTNQLADLRNTETYRNSPIYVFPETPVTVIYTVSNEKYAWEGVLTRYDGAEIDAQTRMVPCLVQVDNPSGGVSLRETSRRRAPNLLVGMFVEIRIRLQPASKMLEIPETALHPGNQIWLVSKGKLISHKIRIANTLGDKILVFNESGSLAANDKIVVSPLASPSDGKKVKPILREEGTS